MVLIIEGRLVYKLHYNMQVAGNIVSKMYVLIFLGLSQLKWYPVIADNIATSKRLYMLRGKVSASIKPPRKKALQKPDGFSFLFQNNPLPMWIYDLESLRFLEVNEAAVEHYGYSRAEFLRMRLSDIRPKEDVERLKADLRASRKRLQYSGEWRHLKKDGTLIM